MQKRVLFTGGRAPVTLDLVRMFSRVGHTVYTADSIPFSLASYSKYVSAHYQLSAPKNHFNAFVTELKTILIEQKIDILIPNCEEVFYISKAYTVLANYSQVFTVPISDLVQLHSKFQFVQLLQKLSLPFPISTLVHCPDQLAGLIDQAESYVLKAEFSRFAHKIFIKKDAATPSRKEEITVGTINKSCAWVFQEYIEGKHYCAYGVFHQGRCKAHAVYPIRYRFGEGAAIYFESVDIPEIHAITSQIASELNYTGHLSFDFIHSEKDGKYYAIECNPRATSGIHLIDRDSLTNAITYPENRQGSSTSYTASNKMLFPLMCASIFSGLKERGIHYLTDIFRATDVIWDWKDIRPVWGQIQMLRYFYAKASSSGCSLTEATTLDIEWNGD